MSAPKPVGAVKTFFRDANNKISALYQRGSIRHIVFASFTLTAIATIVMTAVTFYARFSNQLDDALQVQNQSIVEQAGRSLTAYLADMIRLIDSASFHAIKNVDVASASGQLQLLYDVNSKYVRNITLFSADGRMLATAPPATLKANASVSSTPWFSRALEQTENLHFFAPAVQNLFVDAEGQYNWVISLSAAAEITEGRSVSNGVLLIGLRYNGVAELFSNAQLTNGGYIFLIDEQGEIIYHPKRQLIASGLFYEPDIACFGWSDGDYQIGDGSEARIAVVRTVGYTGWTIVGVVPRRGLTLDGIQNILFVLTISVFYLAIVVLVNYAMSSRLTEPIKRLELSVQQVESGLSRDVIYEGGSLEVRQLGRSIKQMVDIMRKLTDDIVTEQTNKQKSELNALQAQINPHFLYNTLDSLVWMIEKEEPKEALKLVSALAKLFRLSLSSGRNVITVRDELEHARNYLMIQQMRYKNKFTFTIAADDETLELSSIKLILQPIVENSIYHSMEFMLDGEGEIMIKANIVDGELRFLVSDNGLGMKPDVVSQLLTRSAPASHRSGIGLKNVHERIGLYFGADYGVSIDSEPDAGTRVMIRMPAIPYQERALE